MLNYTITNSIPLPSPITAIDNGSGGVELYVSEGASIPVTLGDREEVTLTNTANAEDTGLLYEPSVLSGAFLEGQIVTFDLGIVYYEGAGPVTIVQDLQRDSVTIQADIRTVDGPDTYDYTILAADAAASLSIKTTLTNGANVVVVDTVLSVPNPIIAAGAVGWYDFSDASRMSDNGLSGGIGTEIGLVEDKTAFGNNLTQTVTVNAPQYTDTGINGLRSMKFSSARYFILPAITLRSMFFVVQDPLGNPTAEIAPLLGTDYSNTGGTHHHIFIRANGATDYDVSIDGGGTADTGTVWVDTGDTGTGGNITLTGLSVAEREGLRLWYIEWDAGVTMTDAVIGALRSGFDTYRNTDTLFGEIALFPTTLTATQANDIANLIVSKWGLTWSDIT